LEGFRFEARSSFDQKTFGKRLILALVKDPHVECTLQIGQGGPNTAPAAKGNPGSKFAGSFPPLHKPTGNVIAESVAVAIQVASASRLAVDCAGMPLVPY
jgi:hypothetical protein